MRIIGITALLATTLIGGCKKENTQPNVTGNNLVGNTAAVEDYSRMFDDPSMDAKLKADFNTEMAKVDQVFKSEMQAWGLDVVELRSILEKGAEDIGTKFPEIKNEVAAAAASLIKVLELALGGQGIVSVTLELKNAIKKLNELEGVLLEKEMFYRVDPHVKTVIDTLATTVFTNPKTTAVVTAIGRQAIAVLQPLIASHPETAQGLGESVSQIEEMLRQISA